MILVAGYSGKLVLRLCLSAYYSSADGFYSIIHGVCASRAKGDTEFAVRAFPHTATNAYKTTKRAAAVNLRCVKRAVLWVIIMAFSTTTRIE